MGIKEHVLKHKRLHPVLVLALQPRFVKEDIGLDLHTVRVRKAGRFERWLNRRLKNVWIWESFGTVVFLPERFHIENPRAEDGSTIWRGLDFSTAGGLGTLSHELRHVPQGLTWSYWKGIVSWFRGQGYSHKTDIEVEALAFEHRVVRYFMAHPEKLKAIKQMGYE